MKQHKLLAINYDPGRGVYDLIDSKDIGNLLKQHTGKITRVSYKIFDIEQREEAEKYAKIMSFMKKKQKNPKK